MVLDLDRLSGIGILASYLVRSLSKIAEVHVFCSKSDNIESRFANVCQVKTIPRPHFARFATFAAICSLELSNRDFDVVHSFGDIMLGPDVVTEGSCHKAWIYKVDRRRRFLPGPTDLEALAIAQLNFSKGTQVIANSQGLKQEFVEFYNIPEEKISVVYPGVDSDIVGFASNRDNSRRSLGVDREDILLVQVFGHGVRKRGVDRVIESLPLCDPNVKFLAVGPANPTEIRQIAERHGVEKRVISPGFVPHQNVGAYLSAGDIFVCPTLYEGFSIAPLEAMAMGLPVLGTRANGLPDIIENGRNGFFINRSAEDISDKVRLLASDSRLTSNMSRNARDTAAKFTWDRYIEAILTVYQSLMKR